MDLVNQFFLLGVAILVMIFGFDCLIFQNQAVSRGLTQRILMGLARFAWRQILRLGRFARRQAWRAMLFVLRHAWRGIRFLARALGRQIRRFLRWSWTNHPRELAVAAALTVALCAVLALYIAGHLP